MKKSKKEKFFVITIVFIALAVLFTMTGCYGGCFGINIGNNSIDGTSVTGLYIANPISHCLGIKGCFSPDWLNCSCAKTEETQWMILKSEYTGDSCLSGDSSVKGSCNMSCLNCQSCLHGVTETKYGVTKYSSVSACTYCGGGYGYKELSGQDATSYFELIEALEYMATH